MVQITEQMPFCLLDVFTHTEQGRKLMELGCDTNTADLSWDYKNTVNDDDYNIAYTAVISFEPYRFNEGRKYNHPIQPPPSLPAWSLSALLQLMPETIYADNNNQIYKMQVYNHDGQCCCDYVGELDGDSLICFASNSYIYSAFQMVCWLLENNRKLNYGQ